MQNINDKMLTGAALIFVGGLIVALLLQWWLAPPYKTDNLSIHQRVVSGQMLIRPWQLKQMHDEGVLSTTSLVLLNGATLKQKDAFSAHLELTTSGLLSAETLKWIRQTNQTFVLAPDESEALAATWILRAKGYDEVYAIANDPQFVQENVLGVYHPRWAQTTTEQARYDFGRFFGNAPKPANTDAIFAPPAGAPQVKKAAGGC